MELEIPKSALTFAETSEVNFEESEDERFASMLAYSGKPMEHWLFGQLVVDVNGINFDQNKIPILEGHDDEKRLGVADKPSTDNNQVYFDKIRLLDNDLANQFYQDAKAGFPFQASISFYPRKIEEILEGSEAKVNDMTVKGPALIFRESNFRESSVVVFGMDHRTSSVAQGDENVTINLSEENAQIIQKFVASNMASVSNPRTPKYSGTEDSPSWGQVDKSFQAYVDAYYDSDDEKPENWSDASNGFKSWAASTSLAGDKNASTFDKGVYYPVVNPNTSRLNKGGVLAAERYAKQSEHNAVANKARNLYEKEFEKKENEKMEEVTELKTQIQSYEEKLSQYEQEMAQLRKESTQKDLTQKLGQDEVDFLMKFYDKLTKEDLNEIADKLVSYQKTINDMGQAQGSDETTEPNREPTAEDIQKYAKEHGISMIEATRQLYEQIQ